MKDFMEEFVMFFIFYIIPIIAGILVIIFMPLKIFFIMLIVGVLGVIGSVIYSLNNGSCGAEYLMRTIIIIVSIWGITGLFKCVILNNESIEYKICVCGEENEPDSVYCGECGELLVVISVKPYFCTECGEELSADDKFCNGCGTKRKDLAVNEPSFIIKGEC